MIQTINSMNFDQSSSDYIAPITNNSINAQLLQEIYKIQDSISKLTETIAAKDSTAVSVLADKLANTNTKTAETVLIETVLPKLIENPEQLMKLAEIANKLPAKK